MPKSQQAPVVPVLDFLYVDRERLDAFRTQILGSGTPLESKVVDNYKLSEGSSEKAGVPIISATMSSSDERTVGTEHRFDPAWLSIIATLDELDRRGLIRDEIIGVPVGSIVRMHGFIQLADLGVMPHLWNPIMRMPATQAVLKATVGAVPTLEGADLAEIAKSMPHPLVVQMIAREDPYGSPIRQDEKTSTNWGILSPQNVIGSSESFSLMNGGFMVGEYEIIALLDVGASPGATLNMDFVKQQNAFHVMLQVQQEIRKLFGRPEDANGITPLVISRRLNLHRDTGAQLAK